MNEKQAVAEAKKRLKKDRTAVWSVYVTPWGEYGITREPTVYRLVRQIK